MPRPTNQSLNYFPLDCDFFDDDKIALTADEFGIAGELVAIKLLCRIYSTGGYFCEWNEESPALFSRRVMYGAVDTETICKIVGALINRGFFCKEAFAQFGILTSRGIVKRFSACHKYHPVFLPEHLPALKDLGFITDRDVFSDKTEKELKKRPVISEEEALKKSKVKKKKDTLQTNKQTDGEIVSEEDPSALASLSATESQQNAIRERVKRILVRRNDFTVDRQLVDLAAEAVVRGTAGITLETLKRISKNADSSVALYESSNGRAGKPKRWQTIADEIHDHFRSAGLPFPNKFSGLTEPPPQDPPDPLPPEPAGANEPIETDRNAYLLARNALLSDKDPVDETLEQTQLRLKCGYLKAFAERTNWKIIREYQENQKLEMK